MISDSLEGVRALPIARSVSDLRAIVDGWKAEGLRVGLVPTMGALHAGHLSLVRLALSKVDRVVASVFVNPTQFGPNEDFAAYPRDEAADAAKLGGAGAHLLYAPDVAGMYPPGFSTAITVSGVSSGLCGDLRPGHFQGVATVVAKLFLRVRPDVAVFGEKDYQQLLVLKRLVSDLDLAIEVIGAPIVRETDGLALSSRNAYLSAEQRALAPGLYRTLRRVGADILGGGRVDDCLAWGIDELKALGFGPVDYLDLRDGATLERLDDAPEGPGRLLCAAYLGKTRLIDNLGV
ncbi:pantoate--beta-alanine ligase [Rhodospirillum rubrum]|uniref:pantoate--beta-alanine ligase n=1 Tax=Rhodospirillum rubrum TaxID=1085 RepID=UPI001907DDB5|nr:pantoate--beta-alanine ligase [Rhodospirillum rubrum]MBK1666191.1 pantoate--beta-alanine ligase [Rhodospirillum rubrum]MBK1678328.1 pantoate--beta-alanine ligase [Rhodospirillum rubrum]